MKVVIRPWKKEDAPALAALLNNFNVWKNLRDRVPYPYLPKDAAEWIDFNLSADPVTAFAVDAGGVLAGAVGFILQTDVYRRNIEIGYYIGESFWGQGIATAAIKQLTDMLAANYDVVRLYAGVFESNKGSMRVLEKNGFHLEAIHKNSIFKNNELLDEHIWVKLV